MPRGRAASWPVIASVAVLFVVVAAALALPARNSWWVEFAFAPAPALATRTVSPFAGTMAGNDPSAEGIGYLATLLRSRPVLRHVAAREYGNPGSAPAWLPDHLGFVEMDSARALRAAAGALETGMIVTTDARAQIARVRLEAPEPWLAVVLGNALLAATDSIARVVRGEATADELRFLEEREDRARADLVSAESALAALYEANRRTPISGPVRAQRNELDRQVDRRADAYWRVRAALDEQYMASDGAVPALVVLEPPAAPKRAGFAPGPLLLTAMGAGIVAGVLAALVFRYAEWQVQRHPGELIRLRTTLVRLKQGFLKALPWRGRGS